DRADVLPLVTALVDKSLVVAADAPPDAPAPAGGVRYTLLETLREFALRRLVAAGDAEATRSRHAAWYRDLAAAASPALQGAEQLQWLARLEIDHDNLRAALAWTLETDPPDALRLATDLAWFWW